MQTVKTKFLYGKNKLLILLLLIAILTTTGYRQQESQSNTCDIRTFQMVPSSNEVEEFMQYVNNLQEEDYTDTCYNITPQDIAHDYGFRIFKFDASCRSYLLYENEIYPLGTWFGGIGVTSFAVADLNTDGKFELYFTFSWGSGMHRSQVGYFDSASKEVTIFDYDGISQEFVLTEDTNHVLSVHSANCNMNSFVDMELSAKKKIATIVGNSSEISLVKES